MPTLISNILINKAVRDAEKDDLEMSPKTQARILANAELGIVPVTTGTDANFRVMQKLRKAATGRVRRVLDAWVFARYHGADLPTEVE